MSEPTRHKKPEKAVGNPPKAIRRVAARPMGVGGAADRSAGKLVL